MAEMEHPAGDLEPTGDQRLPDGGAGDKKDGLPAADKAPDGKQSAASPDSVDDKGVPWKNRVAESDRKRDKLQRELEVERAQRLDLERRILAAAEQQQHQTTVEQPDLATTILTEPAKFQQATVEEAVRLAEWKQYQARIIAETLTEFPDLKDRESDFFKEVSEEYDARKRYFGRDDAALLRDAAAQVDRRKLKEKIKPSMEAAPPMGEPGSRAATTSGKKTITESQRTVARELGLSEAEALEVYSRDHSESVA